MTQKHMKFINYETSHNARESRRAIKPSAHLAFNRCKAVVLSQNDDKKMAVESSKARLVNLGKPNQDMRREFGSYFLGASDAEPSYLITSHSKFFTKEGSVLTTYPSVVQQSLKWNPNVETSSLSDYKADIDTSTDMEDVRYNCKCQNCFNKNCPSKMSIASTLKPTMVYKNNIITFNDRYTMTAKLNDASCGALLPMVPAKASNMSVLATDMDLSHLNNSYMKPHIEHTNDKPKPIPILKKADYDSYCPHARKLNNILPLKHQAVRDTDFLEDYKELNNSCSNTSLFASNKTVSKSNILEPQARHNSGTIKHITLYNEGISDEVFFSPHPISVPFPSPIHIEHNKKSSNSQLEYTQEKPENGIPFCHRNESKYHQDCRKPRNSTLNDTGIDKLITSNDVSKFNRKIYREVTKSNAMSKMIHPKRVLTSNKDIEFYINSTVQKTTSKTNYY